MRKVTTCVLAACAWFCVVAPEASAGNYYVYACSSYGNTAPAFASWADSSHLNAANECMQPAPGGGYRSLEINNPPQALIFEGRSAHWIANTPSPAISIVGAYTPPYAVLVDCSLQSDGFSAQYFWGGGSKPVDYLSGFGCNSQGYGYGTGIDQSFSPSSYFGWGVTCSYLSTCSTSSSAGAVFGVQGIRLTAQENGGPGLIADGSNNLWYQLGHWVRGGGWPVGFTALDPSGVCRTDLFTNWQVTSIDSTTDTSPDTSSFTQCWANDTVAGTLDTTSFPNGPLTITYAAENAAGVGSTPSQTVQVDNTPVTLSLATPDDPDPNVWVNHAVHVTASASAGPSGINATYCSTNDGPGYAYPEGGITLDGSGVWKVACSAWNNSLDVSGQPYIAIQSVAVRIDETPPAISFEAANAADPQTIVVDTTDGQSGVAGGKIEMRPATGGSWASLATQFDGSHLKGRLDDSALPPGQWLLQATACDHAGNCASTQRTLNLPVRQGSISTSGLEKLEDLHGAASRCARRHPKPSRARRRQCTKTKIIFRSREQIGFGAVAHLRGILTTLQGSPIVGAAINVLSAPANGSSTYSQLTTATTGFGGSWTATLPPGPSRTIEAIYAGSPTIQPSMSSVEVIVPASVRVLRVWPRHVRWGGKVHIEARLVGGYLPPQGALVRLRLGYGNARTTYGVQEHVAGNGTFVVTNTFGAGPAGLVLHYWLQECTLPEGDYPFAPSCGPRSGVTVGGR